MKNSIVMALMGVGVGVVCGGARAQSEAVGVLDASEPGAAEAVPYQEHLESYEARSNHGFTVMVHQDMIAREPELLEHVMLLLGHDLAVMEEVLPGPAYEALLGVPVWIERQGAVVEGGMSGRGMCFHVSAGWLVPNGLLREKVGGVEIVRAADFSVWRRNQPFMTFHEFSHAYHHLLGAGEQTIIAAYEAAKSAGLYDAVDRNTSTEPVVAYAITNHTEYFAELSEAYFGLNDFYPYTRSQLAEHDPAGFAAVEALWSLTVKEIAERVESEGFGVDG